MNAHNRLSGIQLFSVAFLFNVGMPLLLMTGPTIKFGGQDAWMSGLIATCIGVYATGLMVLIARMYPNQTFVQYCPLIFGKWLGSAIAFVYLAAWTAIVGIALRQVLDYIITTEFSRTPMFVIALTTALVLWYMVHAGGIGSIGKSCNILAPVVAISAVFIFIGGLPNAQWSRLLPLDLAEQWPAILGGSTPGASLFGQTIVISMFLPFLEQPRRHANAALWGLGVAGFLFAGALGMVVATLGEFLPTRQLSPLYNLTTFISMGEFLQNLDVLIVLVGYFSSVIRLAVYQFSAAYGWSQLFGLRNWRIVNTVLAVAILFGSMVPQNYVQATTMVTQKVIEPIMYPYFLIAFPTALYAIAMVKTRLLRKTHRTA